MNEKQDSERIKKLKELGFEVRYKYGEIKMFAPVYVYANPAEFGSMEVYFIAKDEIDNMDDDKWNEIISDVEHRKNEEFGKVDIKP